MDRRASAPLLGELHGLTRIPLLYLESCRLMDLLSVLLSFVVTAIVWNVESLPDLLAELPAMQFGLGQVAIVLGLILFWKVLFSAAGLYNRERIRDVKQEAMRVVGAVGLGTMPMIAVVLLGDAGRRHLLAVLFFWTAAVVMTLLSRLTLRKMMVRTGSGRDVVIVGSGRRALSLYRSIEADQDGQYNVLGFVDSWDEIHEADIRERLIGGLEDLEEILMRSAVDEVIIALPVRSCYAEIEAAIRTCERVGVDSRYLADVFEYELARPRYHGAGELPAVSLKVAPDDVRLVVKRTIDIVGAAVGLVVLSPLMLMIAIAVKLSSPGPVVFAQDRYGLNKRIFRMYKFRTMVENAEVLQIELEHLNEASGPAFKIRNDPRITAVGRFLRKTSLDELPQLWNVLRGEMALVGPRPMSLRDVHLFDESWLMRRFSIRPGLTCLWQISGRSNLSFDDWIVLDLKYIDEWSLWLDMRILAKTVPVVIKGTGAQ